MRHRDPLGVIVKRALVEHGFHAERLDIGSDAKLSRHGIHFTLESYEVKGLGHFCVLNMHAMFGLMKMESVVLTPKEIDVPTMNLDWISVMKKETQLIELYDVQINAYPQEKLDAFAAIKEKDADLSGYDSGDRWYKDYLYPCSYAKAGKGVTDRYQKTAVAYADTYLAQCAEATPCRSNDKTGKIRAFAEKLISQGGPAVDQMTKLFGEEVTRRVILSHMYGVR